jgi:hypothetical protein
VINPFRNWIVGNPWDGVEGDGVSRGLVRAGACSMNGSGKSRRTLLGVRTALLWL